MKTITFEIFKISKVQNRQNKQNYRIIDQLGLL